MNAPIESPDYQRGKADGIIHAETLNNAKIAQSINEVSVTLSDMTFGYEEARQHILEQMQSLVRQISDQVIPEIAKATFGSHLSEIVDVELNRSANLPIQIGIAPDLLPAFDALGSKEHCVFVPVPNLTAGQAIILQNDVEILLDLPSLVLALQSTLNGLESHQRSSRNGN
ncbi:hypothetical protein [Octadecabacter temperatus]|uniref:hypothetical protein n=1 Tax=Octadecabacter temperatus TaxID=1458307 RepID=UPI00117E27EF|nr:hypothetical protein [Octadecabacter temperatus]